MYQWYLFPETLPSNSTPTQATVNEYLNSLTATARAQGRDRFFTSIASIAEDSAFFASGSNAGFGIRLFTDTGTRRVFIAEAYEGAPGLEAGIDRGTEILAIGTTSGNLLTVDSIIASEGTAGISNALGPTEAGTTRVLRISDAAGTREVTVTKRQYEFTPVSSRYGGRIIDDEGRRVGYLNFRVFIETADPALRNVFAQFRAAGITEIIVDLRYNGGGLISIANLMGNLMGANRSSGEVFLRRTFRAEKSSSSTTQFFAPQPQSIAPTRVAFIGTGSTFSSSELVINSMIPYLGNSMALVGTNTGGKPVGQIWIDRPQCDDRLKVTAFTMDNAVKQSSHFNGLAETVPQTCQAVDDLSRQLGDPQEASTRQALDFLAGRSCTPITGTVTAQQVSGRRELLTPDQPTTVQREAPGTF